MLRPTRGLQRSEVWCTRATVQNELTRKFPGKPGCDRVSDVPILVCDCGKKLRAPGAIPGRVGRCPACGGMLRVAGPLTESPPPPLSDGVSKPPSPLSATAPGAPVAAPSRKRRKRRNPETAGTEIWDGLVAAPTRPETRIRDSLLYPLWGATGIAALVILPPLLWVMSVMFYEGTMALVEGKENPAGLMGLLIAMPSGALLLLGVGYTLLFLGRVLAASALGEPHHPRWPDWDVTAILHGLGRWLLAGLVGGLVGVGPAILYWTRCGAVGLANALIIAALLAVGLAYGLMALLASILHEDARAANPLTVVRAIVKLGRGYLRPCLVCGGAVLLTGSLLYAVSRVDDPLLARGLVYVVWLVALYATMVVFRVLGLFYGRNARALGWFRNRKRWGL